MYGPHALAGTTYVVRRAGPREFLILGKRNGKTFNHESLELSDDGSVITDFLRRLRFSNRWRGRRGPRIAGYTLVSQWRPTLELPSQTDLYFERELIEDNSKIRSICRLCGVSIHFLLPCRYALPRA